MRPLQHWAITTLALVTAGCDSQPDSTLNGSVNDTMNVTEVELPSTPNYDEREGDLYMYVAAVSEEDQKKGKSTGNVVLFRYLGVRDGVHRLENVTDGGARIDILECASPCKVIKAKRRDGTVQRTGYNPGSVIGSAFEDAFNGKLVPAKGAANDSNGADQDSRSADSGANRIPAAFTGEWNAELKDCGTGLNDSRLRVEPRRLRFYESDGEVTDVKLEHSQSVTVRANFAGEGETWKRDVQMVLSRSGSDLTIEGYTRHRCPA